MVTTTASDKPQPAAPFRLNWALLGALCAVLWSCYTTGTGIYTIVGKTVYGAFFLTAVVQLTLATVSWLLGKDIAHWITGQPQQEGFQTNLRSTILRLFIYIIVFILTFCISAFFSFNFYFHNLYSSGQEAIDLQNRPQHMETRFMQPLRQDVEKTSTDNALAIANNASTQAWAKVISSVLDRAADPTEQSKLQASLHDRDDAKRKLSAAKIDMKKKEDARHAFDQQIQQKADELATAHQKVLDAQKVADDEAKGRGGIEGKGPKYDADIKLLVAAQKIENGLRDDLKRLRDLAAQADKDFQDARKTVDDLTRQAGGDSGAPQATTVDGEVNAIRRQLTTFVATPASQTYQAIVGECTPLLAAMRAADPKDTALSSWSCESPLVEQILKPQDDLLERRDRFKAACTIDAMTATKSQGAAGGKAVLAAAQKVVEGCFTLALELTSVAGIDRAVAKELQTSVNYLQSDFQTYIETTSPDLDEFTQTLRALPFLNKEPSAAQSAFGGLISVVQDAFILVLSLFAELLKAGARKPRPVIAGHLFPDVSDHEDDTAHIRAAKTLLRLSTPVRGSESSVLVDMGDAQWAAVSNATRDNAVQALRTLQRSGYVRALRGGKFEVSLDGALALERTIVAHAEQVATGTHFSPLEPEPPAPAPVATESSGRPAEARGPAETERPATRAFSARQAFDEINKGRTVAAASNPPTRGPDGRNAAAKRSSSATQPEGNSKAADTDAGSQRGKGSRDSRGATDRGSDELGPLEARLNDRSAALGDKAPAKKS